MMFAEADPTLAIRISFDALEPKQASFDHCLARTRLG
jgi:hypothetical protein